MLLATLFFWMPAENTVAAQQGHGNSHRKHDNNGKKKSSHGYKNYGQYHKTQVGHRRYRTVKRYYWNDGVRLSRYVRVYY